MSTTVPALSILLALLAAPTGAQGQNATWPAKEYLGLELAPGWVNIASDVPLSYGDVPTFSPGGVATLRVFRRGWGKLYWTPIQVGVGGSHVGILLHLSTEAGLRHGLPSSSFVEVGTAAGVGLLAVEFAKDCDGGCYAGGSPIMLSPVARLGLVRPGWTLAFFTRAFIPVDQPHTLRKIVSYGAALVFGLDLGWPSG